jgi:hypothetical protein
MSTQIKLPTLGENIESGDVLTISGTLLDNYNGHCQDAPAVPNIPDLQVDLMPAESGFFTDADKHVSCSGQTQFLAVSRVLWKFEKA